MTIHTFIENIDFMTYATGHRLLETEIPKFFATPGFIL